MLYYTFVVLYNMTHVMSCVMLYHVIILLYNIDVLTELKFRCSNRSEQKRTCYITCVMLHKMCHAMLYKMCQVMLYNICHFMLYNICYVMLYNICYVMLYNIKYVMLCYVMTSKLYFISMQL